MNSNRSSFWRVALAVLAAAAAAQAEAPWQPLTRLHGEGYWSLLRNRNSPFKEERFVSEGALSADIFLLSYARQTHLVGQARMAAGMGQADSSNLPFAVQEGSYTLAVYLEHERGPLLARLGLDHSCSHIFLDDENPWYEVDERQVIHDVYYNRLFVGFGHRTMRRAVQRDAYRAEARPSPWAAYGEVGYYLQDAFGWFDPTALNDGNDWWWDLRVRIRRRLWHPSWGSPLFLANDAQLLLDRNGNTTWRLRPGFETLLVHQGFGAAFSVTFNALDQHPRDSREDVIELTMRYVF